MSFYVTWTLIFDFFGEYLTKFNCDNTRFSLFTCSSKEWLEAPSGDTFIEAYVQVTNSMGGWIWSSSLLCFVVPACLWLHIAGSRVGLSKTKQISFLLLAFLGAVSASFPIAFAVIYCRQCNIMKGRQPIISGLLMALPSGIALLSSMLLPLSVSTNRWVYVIALVLLHFILMVPALFNSTTKSNRVSSSDALKLALCYAAMGGAIGLQHFHNIANYALTQLSFEEGILVSFGRFRESGWSNNCQSSISFDTVFSSTACVLFLIGTNGLHRSLPFILIGAFFSPACMFSMFLSWEALNSISKEKQQYID
jgi:hypothetical protein